MKFLVLNDTEYTEFFSSHPLRSFMQTIEWTNLKAKNGWKKHLVGVIENNKIIAATLLLSRQTPIKKNIFYAPRGPLLDYKDTKLLSFFTENIKKYIKRNNGIFLKLIHTLFILNEILMEKSSLVV